MNNTMVNNNVTTIVQKGQVWFADLIGTGSMEVGRHPVVIFSNPQACKFSSVITVVPLTSKSKKYIPTHVTIKSCVQKESTALAENIITISKSMLVNYIGKINTYELNQLEKAVLVQLGILNNVSTIENIN